MRETEGSHLLGLALAASLGLAACGGGGSGGAAGLSESWAQIGPDGGFVTDVGFGAAAGELWISADDGGGLYRSADSGVTWAQVATLAPNTTTHSLAIDSVDPSWMYAPSHFGRGFQRSSDGGATWQTAGAGLPTDTSSIPALLARRFHDLAVDPTNPTVLWAALADGLFVSADSGASFAKLDPMVVSSGQEADIDARVVAVSSGGGVAAGVLFVGTARAAVYRSDDGGTTWSVVSAAQGHTLTPVSAIALTDNALYVAFFLGGVTRSTTFTGPLSVLNGGAPCGMGCSFGSAIWTKLVAASGASAATDVLYAGTVDDGASPFGLFRSDDGGASWAAKNAGLGGFSCQSLALDPADATHVVYGAMGGGVFESTDGGDTWTARSAEVKATISLGFAEDPADADHLLASGTVGLPGNTGGFFETTDRGTTWTRVTSLAVDATALDVSPAASTNLLAAGWRSGIHRSTNGTAGPWTQVMAADITPARFVRDAVNPSRVYASAVSVRFFLSGAQVDADNGVYVSTNDGATWSQPISGSGGYYVAVHPDNEGEALALGDDVLATTDSFASMPTSLGLAALAPGEIFLSAAFDPDDPAVVVVGTASARTFVTTSYDPSGTGVTWQEVPNPAQDVFIRRLTISADGWFATCWMGDMFSTPSSTEGILFSPDRGASWRFLDVGMGPNRLVYEHFPSAFDPRRIYVGMWDGGPLELSLSP